MTARDEQIKKVATTPVAVLHQEGCPLRNAILCTTPIECPHGYDVCATCDRCTCEDLR